MVVLENRAQHQQVKLYSQRGSGSVDVKLRERDLKGVAWIRKDESEIRPFVSYLTHYKAWHLQLPDICWLAFIMNLRVANGNSAILVCPVLTNVDET